MTDQEILKNAIDKAVKNGLDINKINENWTYYPVGKHHWGWHIFDGSLGDRGEAIDIIKYMNVIIFNHSFAKAFWGEEEEEDRQGNMVTEAPYIFIPAWKYHLKRMVLKTEPLKYLERFIN